MYFLAFLVVRLSSVFLVQTWFVPDEYWQSLEIAHRLIFGYGYLTWEWYEGIRSLIYPLLFSIPYKIMEHFCFDDQKALVYVPRLLQAIFTAWSEWKFSKGMKKILNQSQILWFVLLQLGTYFMFYTGSRTLANTVEMNLVLLGITYFLNQHRGSFLLCIIVSCYIRPTCIPLWLPLTLHFIWLEKTWIFSIGFWKVFIRCLSVLGALLFVDSWWYGKFTLVPFQFLLFNLVNDFSEFYGEHSWHWYFTNALPSLMGPTMLPLLLSLKSLKTLQSTDKKILSILVSVALFILGHSIVGHKEIRFLTPVVPLLNMFAALKLPSWRWRRIFLILFCIWNIPIGGYLSLRHQRGVLDATNFIASSITQHDKVLYLMPCHSTPLYSHVHVNATLQFLTCPPNLSHKKDYVDEADRFYDNPMNWMLDNPASAHVDYLVFFDGLLNSISPHLNSNGYNLIANFFHTDIAQGRVSRRVLIFKKNKYILRDQ